MSFGDRIREKLELMIENLGGTVPAVGSPQDEENRTVELLDSLADSLAGSVVPLAFTFKDGSELPTYLFYADRDYEVDTIDLIYGTAETTAATLNLIIKSKSAGDTLASGGTQISSFNCKDTANAVRNSGPNATLSEFQRLSVELSATSTELAKITLVIRLRPA